MPAPRPLNALESAGATLRTAREQAGLSVAELARKAGTSRAAISQIEKGEREPSVATLTRLLGACGHRLVAIPLDSPITPTLS